MATKWDASAELAAANDAIVIDVPQDGVYQAVLRTSGTFVGTVKIQKSSDNGAAYTDVTMYDSTGNSGSATDADLFIGNLASGADYCRILCSAYTSGTIRAEVVLLPDA